MKPDAPSAPDEQTVAAIVAWMLKQAAVWCRRAYDAERKFGRDHSVTAAAAGIAAGYSDHAAAIERGEPFWSERDAR